MLEKAVGKPSRGRADVKACLPIGTQTRPPQLERALKLLASAQGEAAAAELAKLKAGLAETEENLPRLLRPWARLRIS